MASIKFIFFIIAFFQIAIILRKGQEVAYWTLITYYSDSDCSQPTTFEGSVDTTECVPIDCQV